MSLILDTHVVIWLEEQKEQIPESTRIYIAEQEQLLLSKASVWEMAIKISTGRLRLRKDLDHFIGDFLKGFNCLLLDISLEDILEVQTLVMHHRDPFDRMLIAQSICNKYSIASADKIFDKYPVNRIW